MEYSGILVGLGLVAASLMVIGFVRYRERETATLRSGVELARELRDLAGDDPVRIAAVDEYETSMYRRLFYASVVAPHIRAGAWALLATALTAFAVLTTQPLDGVAATVIAIVFMILAAAFAVATLVFAGLAIYHTASTPRVSFAESYGD